MYLVSLIVLMKPAWANPGMIGQLVGVLGSFAFTMAAFLLQQNSGFLKASNWESTFFSTCAVEISPMFAHSQMLFDILSQAVLLVMVFLCSTTWYCYICGCMRALVSVCSSSTPSSSSSSSQAETSELLMTRTSAAASGYAGVDEGKKKILFLMSDTGGGHRASCNAIVDALEAQFPGAFEVTIMF